MNVQPMIEERPRRPRPGRPRNLLRRRAIVQEALALFAQHGYEGTSIRQIAAAVGISQSLLTRYYAEKRMIIPEMIEYVAERFEATWSSARFLARRSDSPREALVAFGSMYMSHVDAMSAWYALWFTSLPMNDEQRERIRASEERIYDVAATLMQKRHQFQDPYVLARAFCGSLLALVLLQSRADFEPSSASLRSMYLDGVVSLTMDALVLKPGQSA